MFEMFNINDIEQPIKIKKVVTQICKIIGKGKPQFGKIKYKAGENMKVFADINKAKVKLNWKPKISFDELVKNMVEGDLETISNKY